jgi:hypothetical protein
MLHIFLHFAVPVTVAFAFYRPHEVRAGLIMLVMMAVDLDHLLADPIYDPQRCSIDFHPLHGTPAIVLYGVVFAFALLFRKKLEPLGFGSAVQLVHLSALGLLIHMALDWADCLV